MKYMTEAVSNTYHMSNIETLETMRGGGLLISDWWVVEVAWIQNLAVAGMGHK